MSLIDKERIFADSENEPDELVFMAEETADDIRHQKEEVFSVNSGAAIIAGNDWKILVVDDEEDIHTVTHLTLDDFEFAGKQVKILDAYSAKQALELIRQQPDIAITLLDVVMETTTAGLDLVKQIRGELENHFIRIVLRTGQPGYAPERDVVLNYDINDYKSKTELTSDKIFTMVSSGLRAYKSLISLESFRQNLQEKVNVAVESIREKDHIIIKQSRQVAVSELISNISHQWRQPLNTVMALIQDIEITGEEEELTVDYLSKQSQKAMSIIQDMSNTIDDLRYFFQPVEESEEFILHDVISRCVKLLEPTLQEENIKLEIKGDEQLNAKGYSNDYAQVVLQIINNSRDALREKDISDKEITINILEDSGKAKLEVIDNGGGIAEDVIEHIFEPYFTTHFKSPGRGLNLYMCQIVIEKNMKGSLTAGNMGSGAIFTIRI
ncbi:MAG: ATP-binding protein [Candidatus Stygibacter frigidus]|nr:ATP-binding protein [Candidatus Stygibacter frigidus]